MINIDNQGPEILKVVVFINHCIAIRIINVSYRITNIVIRIISFHLKRYSSLAKKARKALMSVTGTGHVIGCAELRLNFQIFLNLPGRVSKY